MTAKLIMGFNLNKEHPPKGKMSPQEYSEWAFELQNCEFFHWINTAERRGAYFGITVEYANENEIVCVNDSNSVPEDQWTLCKTMFKVFFPDSTQSDGIYLINTKEREYGKREYC